MTKSTTTWFASWFNTPFYHILYRDRDYEEAQIFMNNLTAYLNLPSNAKILDLACGRGRHSIYLNQLGYRVTGIDLSEQNILAAKAHENKSLHFEVHDMTEPYPDTFDAVFNLFTSFGYFEDDASNLQTLEAIKADLNTNGFGVIDFMNVNYVLNHLVPENIKIAGGIEFRQQRRYENGYIIKNISFMDNGKSYEFQERVKALKLRDFEQLFAAAGLHLLDVFGDYKLQKYNPENSQRLIMIFK